jgi:ell wall binding domain 2 (CWB2)
VDATAGVTLRYGGRVANALYSSTHGGHSESARFVFGGDRSYLRPVDDSRWEMASDSAKTGVRSWALAVSADQLGAAAGVGRAESVIMLEPRGAAGRVGDPARGYGGVRIEGTDGSKVLSGDALRRALQLPSTLFDIVGGASAAPARPLDPVTRVGGEDRITTAVAVSAAHWPSAAEVLLATSARFPDALASGALAAKLGAPLLLTPTDHLSATVEQELARLKTARVWLLGGELALSAAVEQRLLGLGLEVRRLAGDDRYATAGVVARAAGPSASGEVALVLGADWPDAVAAGSLAALRSASPRCWPSATGCRRRRLSRSPTSSRGGSCSSGGPRRWARASSSA